MSARNTSLELLTCPEMARADALTIAAGTPGARLMENAGAAVAAEAAHLVPRKSRIVVLCGPGNNGGDGFVAARLLAARGYGVSLALLGAREALRGDAAGAAAAFAGPAVPLGQADIEDADLVVDALLGAGLARDLDGLARETVTRLNDWSRRTGRPVLAVDVASGVDGSSGQIRGVAVKASRTITFFRRKPGHLLLPGRLACGETIVADIGIGEEVLDEIAPKAFANGPALWGARIPFPTVAGHKYSRGHALALSGGLAHTGAARLAARGALRAGAGLVTVATPREALAVHAAALTAVMTQVCDGPDELAEILADARKNAVVAGPGLGLGAPTRALVLAALAASGEKRALVLDADALSSFSGEAQALAGAIRASGAPVALTPHEGEYARLFERAGETRGRGRWLEAGVAPQALDAALEGLRGGKLARARAAAALTGALVVLKGPDTVVAAPDGRAAIDEIGPPWLATAGSGDVLAGMIAGLLAAAMPLFEAAAAAVWMHGAAARQFGPGLISEDLPEALPAVLRALAASFAPHV
ncbi:NAD(P)H-hydrate dehydratase [Methylocella sp.]|uniref:NAD(P)H-hydrate dehydratase n=1 Tax=Methylocella sp. TaxID=1978226 RepID=UPI0035AE7644